MTRTMIAKVGIARRESSSSPAWLGQGLEIEDATRFGLQDPKVAGLLKGVEGARDRFGPGAEEVREIGAVDRDLDVQPVAPLRQDVVDIGEIAST